jgi:uncharacterized protein (TIGR02118 family)
MAVVTVTYSREADTKFDFDYYVQRHLPLLLERWSNSGLQAVEVLRGVAGADGGEPPFIAQALLRFSSMGNFQAALDGEHTAEIIGDIPNFTNAQPTVQVNEAIWT